MKKTLTSLINEHLRVEGEQVKPLAAEMRKLTDQDKIDLAKQFVKQGLATEVLAKDKAGAEITIAKAA